MFGDLGKMMSQLKDMKSQMKIAQKELQELVVEGASKARDVIVKINGEMDVQEVKITPALLTSGIEKVEQAVLSAFKDAVTKSKRIATDKMKGLTGGLDIPGL